MVIKVAKELICISCPIGCHLVVDEETKSVTGNTCPRGVKYGISEVFNPVRIITSVVKVKNGNIAMLPVKTNGAIPKKLNFACMKLINKSCVEAPINIGDVILENIFNTGVDVIATKSIDKA